MFEQHPVPQNISSYQFHLVGDMTLKQFLELAAGVVIGVIIYATGLPGLIKWPLILFFGAGGAALAFVPFEERPLEQWIVAFFRSVYSPTMFNWNRQPVKYFQDETVVSAAMAEGKTSTSPFANIPFLAKLEDTETGYLNKISQLFNPTSSLQNANQPSTVNTQRQPQQQTQPVISAPVTQSHPTNLFTSTRVIPDQGTVLTAHVQPEPIQPMQSNVQPKREVNIPQANFVTLDKTQRRGVIVEEINQPKVDLRTTQIGAILQGQETAPAVAAQFSLNAAPPSIPTIVNTVSGQVMDTTGNIVEGAILEIRDEKGRPVRALRTNKAGHFLIVTPLLNGQYKIVIEKEGYNFDPISFEATGAIIQPIAIHARSVAGSPVA